MSLTITVHDARLIASCLADELEQRGLAVPAGEQPDTGRVLDAVEVAGLLGRTRDWVYGHAAELGAFRMGTGRTARYGFDRARIEQWKRDHQLTGPAAAPAPPTARRRGRARQPDQPVDLIGFEE